MIRSDNLMRYSVSTAGTARDEGAGQDDLNRDCLPRECGVNLVRAKPTPHRARAIGVKRAEVQGSATIAEGCGMHPTVFELPRCAQASPVPVAGLGWRNDRQQFMRASAWRAMDPPR